MPIENSIIDIIKGEIDKYPEINTSDLKYFSPSTNGQEFNETVSKVISSLKEDYIDYYDQSENKIQEIELDSIIKSIIKSDADVSVDDKEKFELTLGYIDSLLTMRNLLVASMSSEISPLLHKLMWCMDFEIIEKEQEQQQESLPSPYSPLMDGGDKKDNFGDSLNEDIEVEKYLLKTGLSKEIAEIPHDFSHEDIKEVAGETLQYIHNHCKTKGFKEPFNDDGVNSHKLLKNIINEKMNIEKMYRYEWEYFKTRRK